MKVLLYTAVSDASGASPGAPSRRRIKFLAPMAAGSHPFPSRTRQLSPPAPMIVGPQGPSKVGRCQIFSKDRGASRSDGPLFSYCGGRRGDVFELTAKLAGSQIRLRREAAHARRIAEIR